MDSGFVPAARPGMTESVDMPAASLRIGIDTGAYRSGKLTAVCLRDGPPYILQT